MLASPTGNDTNEYCKQNSAYDYEMELDNVDKETCTPLEINNIKILHYNTVICVHSRILV